MEQSDSIKNLAAALAKAQAAMHGATKDGRNPAFKSTYASLASVIEAARGPLTENGIAFVQMPGAICADGIPITTTLMHLSGEWISSTLVMPVVKRDPQGVGSALTYGNRYSLMAFLGLPAVDDDGEAAMGRDERPRPQAVPQRREAPAEQSSSQRMADQMIRALAGRPSVRHVDAFFAKDEVMRDYGLLDDEDKARVDAAAAARRAEIESGGATLMAGA